MKIVHFLLLLLFSISIPSLFSQTISGRLMEMGTNNNPFDSSFSVTLQIKLDENEVATLGHATNLKFDFDGLGLQFNDAIYLNYNEPNGYQTQPIVNPGGSFTIQNIETELVSGNGQEVTDSWTDFILFNFTITDFSRMVYVCPHNNAWGFHFNSPTLDGDWVIGLWECFEGNVPVELTSFTASVSSGKVTLNWSTATELNNNGFEIIRDDKSIGYVNGAGTITEPQFYTYTDFPSSGSHIYRLKQIDYDGTFKLYDGIEVTTYVDKYTLYQNYPNPFNSTTNIVYELTHDATVNLTVYNTLGQEVAKLVNEFQEAGPHKVQFNMDDLNSGLYLYTLDVDGSKLTKKMTLLK